MQLPLWQLSASVHRSPSSQMLPSGLTASVQVPVLASQVPASWHGSEAAHTTGLAPTQTPLWQVSDWVQASESSQAASSALAGSEQMPVAGLQAPAS